METNKPTRDSVIDYLRIIGIFLAILAHCHIPDYAFEIREFDVSMLVMISGISYLLSYQRHAQEKWFTYAWRRFKRLVLPVWAFLCIYFLFFYFVFHDSFSISMIWKSFALTQSGIMFVWIFRVFFTTALLNPFLRRLSDRLTINWLILLLPVFFLLNDFLFLMVTTIFPGLIGKLFSYLISYTVGYALLSLTGMCLYRAKTMRRWILFTEFFFFWLICALLFRGGSMQAFKNPPQLYYVSYGIWMTCALYGLGKTSIGKIPTHPAAAFLSKQAMTIYLMHILFYYILEQVPFIASLHWPLFYLVLLLSSVLACVLFVYLKDRLAACRKK